MTLLREASPTFDRALTIPCFQDRRDSKKTYRERSMPIFLRITIEIIKQIYIYISRVTNKRILFSFFETTRHVPTCYTAVNLAHAYKDFPLIKKKKKGERPRGRKTKKKRRSSKLRRSEERCFVFLVYSVGPVSLGITPFRSGTTTAP